jgi:hypothetical protein
MSPLRPQAQGWPGDEGQRLLKQRRTPPSRIRSGVTPSSGRAVLFTALCSPARARQSRISARTSRRHGRSRVRALVAGGEAGDAGAGERGAGGRALQAVIRSTSAFRECRRVAGRLESVGSAVPLVRCAASLFSSSPNSAPRAHALLSFAQFGTSFGTRPGRFHHDEYGFARMRAANVSTTMRRPR